MNGHQKSQELSHKSDTELLALFEAIAEEMDRRKLITLPYFDRLNGIIHHVRRHVDRKARIQRL